jgi:DegV family protein with EDD domain
MTVKVVTDSTADIPVEVAQVLGITIVPLYIHFGQQVYQDGVDITADEFYQRLTTESELPKTSAPSSGAFTEAYNRLATETKEIISIHISTKLSATYNSALVGQRAVDTDCQIKIIDSLSTTIGLGLIVITAAKAALAGANLKEITNLVTQIMPRTHLFATVDTLEYLHKGGRIGKAQTLLGSVLNIKPLITMQDGEVYPLERVRGRSKAIARLCELSSKFKDPQEIALAHTTTPDELKALATRISSDFSDRQIYMSRTGSTIGTYLGPGSLTVAIVEKAD